MKATLEVNRAHRELARQHRELRAGLDEGALGWMLPRFLSGSAVGIGITVVMPTLLGGGLAAIDPGSPVFWVTLLGPVVVSAAVTPYLYFKARQRSRLTIDELVEESDGDLASLTSPGWFGRTLRQGLKMALAVGLPVGGLLAIGFPIEELPAGSRLLALAGFVVATAAWTLPGSFLMRWWELKRHAGLRRTDSSIR